MNEIQEYISSLQGIISNIDSIIEKAIVKNQGKILTMIKLRLFNKGIDGSGSKISPLYSPQYVKYKRKKGRRASHVTLRDSGKLYRSFFVEYKNNNIFIESNVDYKNKLITKYGQDIFNLTLDEIRVIIFSFIEPEIIKRINKLPDINIEI